MFTESKQTVQNNIFWKTTTINVKTKNENFNSFFPDKMTAYTDYVYNLEKLTVYVSSKRELVK